MTADCQTTKFLIPHQIFQLLWYVDYTLAGSPVSRILLTATIIILVHHSMMERVLVVKTSLWVPLQLNYWENITINLLFLFRFVSMLLMVVGYSQLPIRMRKYSKNHHLESIMSTMLDQRPRLMVKSGRLACLSIFCSYNLTGIHISQRHQGVSQLWPA